MALKILLRLRRTLFVDADRSNRLSGDSLTRIRIGKRLACDTLSLLQALDDL